MNKAKLCIGASLITLMLFISACSDSGEDNPSETTSNTDGAALNTAAGAPTQTKVTPAPMKPSVPTQKEPKTVQPKVENKPYEFATPDTDIVGLRLGMTPDQVTKIIVDHNSALRMQHTESPIYYQALDERRQAGTFSSQINGFISSGYQENIQVGFLAPPHEARAVAIRRVFSYKKPQILAEDYRTSLFEKYGEPDRDTYGSNLAPVMHFAWYLSSDLNECADMTVNWGQYPPKVSVLSPRRTNPRWLEIEKGCGVVLSYTVSVNSVTGLVGTAKAVLIDVKGQGKAKDDYQAYRDELSRKATEEKRKQLKGATKPKL